MVSGNRWYTGQDDIWRCAKDVCVNRHAHTDMHILKGFAHIHTHTHTHTHTHAHTHTHTHTNTHTHTQEM